MGMPKENFAIKSSLKELDLSEARIMFKHRTEMTNLKFNYKNNREYSKDLWVCHSCQNGSIESQNHILFCHAYSELREGKNINKDKDLVEYIRKVMIIRDQLKITK